MRENRDSTLQILCVPFDLIGHQSYAGVMSYRGNLYLGFSPFYDCLGSLIESAP